MEEEEDGEGEAAAGPSRFALECGVEKCTENDPRSFSIPPAPVNTAAVVVADTLDWVGRAVGGE